MHFIILWLINYGEVGSRGFRLQGKTCETAKYLDVWVGVRHLYPDWITGHPKETAAWVRAKIPWGMQAGRVFPLFLLPPGCTMDCRRWASWYASTVSLPSLQRLLSAGWGRLYTACSAGHTGDKAHVSRARGHSALPHTHSNDTGEWQQQMAQGESKKNPHSESIIIVSDGVALSRYTFKTTKPPSC